MDNVEKFVEEQCVMDTDGESVSAAQVREVYQDFLEQQRALLKSQLS